MNETMRGKNRNDPVHAEFLARHERVNIALLQTIQHRRVKAQNCDRWLNRSLPSRLRVKTSLLPRFIAGFWAMAFSACSSATDPIDAKAITELTGPSMTISVGLGFSTKALIAIKRSTTFDGAVQLTTEGLSPGLLVSFSPASLSTTATLSEMTISALSTLAPGAHTFMVRASSDGVVSRTTTVSVMVTVPAITVFASSTIATVPQGSSHEIPITITREGGYNGIVGLAILGLPAGLTASFSPAAIGSEATASTLTLSAPLSAQIGTKTVALRASAQGLADKSTPLQLTIVPATSPAVLIGASPLLMTVTGGQTVQTTLTLQRFAGFTGAVNVTVDGLPPQLSASADPFAPSSNTTTLRISGRVEEFGVSYLPPATPYQLAVRANGTGIAPASVVIAVGTTFMPQFNLFFEPPSPGAPSPTLKEVTISRGSNATIRMRIHRFQYPHAISLTVSGVPDNVSINLPAEIVANLNEQEYMLALTVGANAVPGVYDLVIRGYSATPLVRASTIVLTVN